MIRPFLPPSGSSARRGAFLIYAIILLILMREVVDVALVLRSGLNLDWAGAFRIFVTLGLAYGLYRGLMWARMLLIVLGMVAFAFVLAAMMSHSWDGTSTFAAALAAAFLAIVAILAFSPAVRAYEAWRQDV